MCLKRFKILELLTYKIKTFLIIPNKSLNILNVKLNVLFGAILLDMINYTHMERLCEI